jgi:hypothetical protein
MYKKNLIICFSILCLFVGCITTNERSAGQFPLPDSPSLGNVQFVRVPDGYFISDTNAIMLINNVYELKAYNKKLEVLIKAMGEYYNR